MGSAASRRRQVLEAAARREAAQGINSVFGRALEDLEDHDGVPRVVQALVAWLRQEDRMKTVGLFRVAGDYTALLRHKEAIGSMDSVSVDQLDRMNLTPHDAANLLKTLLKELPEPLLTFDAYAEFLGAETDEAAWEMLHTIPEKNRNTTLLLLSFLCSMLEHAVDSHMTEEAIALLFAPNILRPRDEDAASILRDNDRKAQCFLRLLRLFPKHHPTSIQDQTE